MIYFLLEVNDIAAIIFQMSYLGEEGIAVQTIGSVNGALKHFMLKFEQNAVFWTSLIDLEMPVLQT